MEKDHYVEVEEEGKEGEEEENDPDFDPARAPKIASSNILVLSQHSFGTNRATYLLNCILGN